MAPIPEREQWQVRFQEWDELVGGVMLRELTLAEMADIFPDN